VARELFFKWIKTTLADTAFFGRSANAVKTQVWNRDFRLQPWSRSAKNDWGWNKASTQILQVLSVTILEKRPFHGPARLFYQSEAEAADNQLNLFD